MTAKDNRGDGNAVGSHSERASTDDSDPHLLAMDVVGLDCVDCAATLQRALAAVEGVRRATLDFGTARLEAWTDGAPGTAAAIAGVVDAAGYSLRPSGSLRSQGQRPSIVRSRRDALTLAAAASLALAWSTALIGPTEVARSALLALAIVLAGHGVARAAWVAVRARRALDMNVLMTIAAVGAVGIGEWSEGATALVLFGVGNMLEGHTSDRARNAIARLTAVAPTEALVRREGRDLTVPIESLAPGDVVVVRPGERIPVDGTVTAGSTGVDEAMLSGEAMPVAKSAGDPVYAGTLNGAGALEVRMTRRVADTAIARIIHMVEEAQAAKAPTQRFVDRFAAVYTPLVIAVAAAIVVAGPLIWGGAVAAWLHRALVMLVIACPCALVLSTPVTIVSAIAAAARRGALVKGGAHLEAVGRLRAVAFDKTGTLTLGRPVVTDVLAFGGWDADDVLALAAAVESRSEHPLGRVIVHEARHRALAVPTATSVEAVPGRGVRAVVDGTPVAVGSVSLASVAKAMDREAARAMSRLEGEGKTVVRVLVPGRLVGAVAMADPVRPGAAEAVRRLRRSGIDEILMLTGDNETTARAVSDLLGIHEFRSGLLPADKAEALRQRAGIQGGVAMVGDGFNDAPALAAADVGVALADGRIIGSDAALETADIVLLAGNLTELAYLVELGRRARRIVAFNVAFSLAVKAVFLGLAAAGSATLWMAVLADVGTSLAVLLNGMRLLGGSRGRGGGFATPGP